MRIRIELYGIPRSRAGVSEWMLEVGGEEVRLGEVLTALARRFPQMSVDCLDGNRLRPGFVANVGGERFVVDPDTPLHHEDAVLILSTDAGG